MLDISNTTELQEFMMSKGFLLEPITNKKSVTFKSNTLNRVIACYQLSDYEQLFDIYELKDGTHTVVNIRKNTPMEIALSKYVNI